MYKMMKGGGRDAGWAYNMVDLITKVAQQVGMRRIGIGKVKRLQAVQRKDFLAHNHIIPLTCSIEQETVLAAPRDCVFLS